MKGREKRKIRRKKSRRERVRRKKMQMREKVGNSRFTVFFQRFEAPEGRKVGSLKRRCGASWPDERWKIARRCGTKHISKSKRTKQTSFGPLLEVEMSKKCTPLWHEAHFHVKMYKTHQVRTTFGSCDVEKVRAVVARSAFRSENAQNTPCSDHFLKFRCRKSARRCGAKHISTSKCIKHIRSGPLLEVEMSKKCTPSWREAHFEVKMYKANQLRTTFGSWDVEKVHAVVARSAFRNQNVQSKPASDHFWKLRCRKSARCCGTKHISKWKCTKHTMFGPLFEVQMSKKCTPLWREAHFHVKMYKTHHVRTTFWSWDAEKVHAFVARSTFPRQNVQNTPGPDHFWKLRCRKSARRFGAKRMSKSKCTKHLSAGRLLEVDRSKKSTPLWREANFEVKMHKAHQVRTLRCRKSARRCVAKHISKSKCTKHHLFAPLLEVQTSVRVAGARDSAPCQKWAKRDGFVAFRKTMAGIGHSKRICKDAFSVAGAVQETC